MNRIFPLSRTDFTEDLRVNYIRIVSSNENLVNGSSHLSEIVSPIDDLHLIGLLVDNDNEHEVLLRFSLSYDGVAYSPKMADMVYTIPAVSHQQCSDDIEPIDIFDYIRPYAATKEDMYKALVCSGLIEVKDDIVLIPVFTKHSASYLPQSILPAYSSFSMVNENTGIEVVLESSGVMKVFDGKHISLDEDFDTAYLLIRDPELIDRDTAISFNISGSSIAKTLGEFLDGDETWYASWREWYNKVFLE